VTGGSCRIAICEDSRAYAAALSGFLEQDPEIEVVATFATGEDVLAGLDGLEADLITMDLELPGISGRETIEAIMAQHPLPILVVSAHAGKQSQRTAEALAAGALEAIHKDSVRVGEPGDVWATALSSQIKRLASLQLKRRARNDRRLRPPPPPRPELDRPARAIAIGASTGGPPALLNVLRDIPADFPTPILVVQHIAVGFGEGLVEWLDRSVPAPVRMAGEGDAARPGIWFAPDDAHLVIESSMTFSLDRETRCGAHMPAVDMLFASLAAAAGSESIGVVLTGMGVDGADGVEAIRDAGGLAIAQDEASSAVYGMPRAARDAGADLILPLDEIAHALNTLKRAGVRG
jgi:two-component system, chemotaxis family, protein-glutamate methylesterase/glutaminase